MQSCADVHAANPSALDGQYTIYPNKHVIPVYCANMASSPADYLTLQNTGGSFNFSQMTGGGAIAAGNLVTHFTKVRLDPATLIVNTGDFAFSSSTGAGRGFSQLAYGVAADCFAPNSARGRANVDLTGLPFQIAEQFRVGGFIPRGTTTFSNNKQTVNLTGGGFCGWNAENSEPDEGAGYRGGPYLHLAFTGLTDNTAPTVNASATTSGDAKPYTGAWTNQNVIVQFACSDADSGIASCTSPITLSTEGANQSVSGTAADKAGNTASASFSNINIDKTAPTVSYSGNAGSYTVDQTVNITCAAQDNLSGVANSTCVNTSGPAYTFALGANGLSATATDNAGNVGNGSTSFTVTVTGASLDALIGRFVSDSGVAGAMQAHVNSIASAPNAHAKAGKLDAFSNLLSAQTGKAVSQQGAATLLRLASAL